jgi:hypothetical protein
MGTWGLKAFENDDASDLYYELIEDGADAHAILAAALQGLDPEYIEVDQGQRAVAAAAMIVCLSGGPDRHLSEYERPWASAHPLPSAAALAPEALAALHRIMASSEESEIHALWAEQEGGLQDWMTEMTLLRDDLAALG